MIKVTFITKRASYRKIKIGKLNYYVDTSDFTIAEEMAVKQFRLDVDEADQKHYSKELALQKISVLSPKL